MPQTVNIPGVGLVNFPDTMSDSDIASAIQTNILPKAKGAAPAETTPSVGATVLHAGEKAIVPTAGFLPGAALGSAAVAPAAAALAATGVGAIPAAILEGGAALLGGMYSSHMAETGQDYYLKSHPEFAKYWGIDESTTEKERKAHPYVQAVANAAPMLATNEFSLTKNIGALREAGSAFLKGNEAVQALGREKLVAAGQPLLNAGLQTGMDLYQQAESGEPIDYGQLGVSALTGLSLGEERALGHMLSAPGRKLGEFAAGKIYPKSMLPSATKRGNPSLETESEESTEVPPDTSTQLPPDTSTKPPPSTSTENQADASVPNTRLGLADVLGVKQDIVGPPAPPPPEVPSLPDVHPDMDLQDHIYAAKRLDHGDQVITPNGIFTVKANIIPNYDRPNRLIEGTWGNGAEATYTPEEMAQHLAPVVNMATGELYASSRIIPREGVSDDVYIRNRRGDTGAGDVASVSSDSTGDSETSGTGQGGVDDDQLPPNGDFEREEEQQSPLEPAIDSFIQNYADRDKEKLPPSTIRRVIEGLKNLFTTDTYERYVFNFQNVFRPWKVLQEGMSAAGSLKTVGKNANDVYGILATSDSVTSQLQNSMIKPIENKMNDLLGSLAKETGKDTDWWATFIGKVREATHATLSPNSRRAELFREYVPLSTEPRYMEGIAEPISPSAIRTKLKERFAEIAGDQTIDVNKRNQLIDSINEHWDRLVSDPDNLDPWGHTNHPARDYDPRTNKPTRELPITPDAPMYDPAADMDYKTAGMINDEYKRLSAQHPEIDQIIDLHKELNQNRKELERHAGIWNAYTDDWARLHRFGDEYVPLKSKYFADQEFDPTSLEGARTNSGMIENPEALRGGTFATQNTLLQSIEDAYTASKLAGRSGLTNAIKNLYENLDANGERQQSAIPITLEGTVSAEERALNPSILKSSKLMGSDRIYHHMPNGDIQIYAIHDSRLMDGLRPPIKIDNPFYAWLSGKSKAITGTSALFHTKFIIAFPPMNFLKHTLSNAGIMSSRYGLLNGPAYLKNVAVGLVNGDFFRSAYIARMYAKGNKSQLIQDAKTNPYIDSALEFIDRGGRAEFTELYDLDKGLAKIRNASRSDLIAVGSKGLEKVNHLLDYWGASWDILSRVKAHEMIKSVEYENMRALGMTPDMANEEAANRAARGAKELTNFSLYGKYGKEFSKFFMFYRPAASTSIAALDALRPAFRNIEDRISRELTYADQQNPEMVARARAKFETERKNARAITASLIGAGMFIYNYTAAMSDNDPQGRNRVAVDDKSRWSRFIRMPVPGSDKFLQIPWGFGLGNLAAMGAQMAMMANGHQSIKEFSGNMSNLAMDLGFPITPSHINPTKDFLPWFVDTVSPSPIKPAMEYVMNRDSMDNEIINTRQSKYTEAYTGGQNIPQIFKDTAAWLYNSTNGHVEIGPNTLYFAATNYFDGLADLGNLGYGLVQSLTGQKNFDYKPVLGSFMGNSSNIDSREYYDLKKDIEFKTKRYNTMSLNPSNLGRYFSDNPLDLAAISVFKSNSGNIEGLQKQMNAIRMNQALSPQQKDDILKAMTNQLNLEKRTTLNSLKWAGLMD